MFTDGNVTTPIALIKKTLIKKMSPQARKTRLCRKARFKKMRVEGTLRMNVFMNSFPIRTHVLISVFLLLSPQN